MTTKQTITPFKAFELEGSSSPVSFISTMDVVEGVQCDVYEFVGDKSKDLGIIRMQPGNRTPLQEVLKGDKTIEGYISGKGRLTITKPDGKKDIYELNDKLEKPFAITVNVGEQMQWEADQESALTAYEICYPPYTDRWINPDNGIFLLIWYYIVIYGENSLFRRYC